LDTANRRHKEHITPFLYILLMMVQQETACLCLLNTGDGLHCTNSDTNGNIRIVS